MPHVRYATVLNVPAQQVWEIVRDFGSLARWFPFVEWTASFEALDGDGSAEAEWVRNGIFRTCLAELERMLSDGSGTAAVHSP